jgi:hypothetical protein
VCWITVCDWRVPCNGQATAALRPDESSHFFPLCPQPAALHILMPPLQEKWASIPDTDKELLPLFECFTSLAQALGAPAGSACLCLIACMPDLPTGIMNHTSHTDAEAAYPLKSGGSVLLLGAPACVLLPACLTSQLEL